MTDTNLAAIVERIEALARAQGGLRDDLRDIYTKAKSAGYDPTALREVIRQRAKGDTSALDSLVAAYLTALGGMTSAPDAYIGNSAFVGLMQVALDATSLGTFKACPRRYELSIVRGWHRPSSGHLEFGSLLHASREAYLKQRWGGMAHEEALDTALAHLFSLIVAEDGTLWTSPIPTKRADTLVQALVVLCDYFASDHLETLTLGGKPTVELSFALPTNLYAADHTITLCGHIDRIATDGTRVYGIDLKSTEGEVNATYAASFTPDNQMSLYQWAIPRLIGGDTATHMMIEAIQVLVSTARPTRFEVTRTGEQMREWVGELQWWIRQMESCAEAAYWPMNDRACKFCEFRSVCSSSPSIRPALLQAHYERRQWNPLESRT